MKCALLSNVQKWRFYCSSGIASCIESHVQICSYPHSKYHFCYRVLKRGCLICIRWVYPFTHYQNKSPDTSIHKCCGYGYNTDTHARCLGCYELKQFSDPIMTKACSIQIFFLNFSQLSSHKVSKDIWECMRWKMRAYVCLMLGHVQSPCNVKRDKQHDTDVTDVNKTITYNKNLHTVAVEQS